jgi:thymidine phosphorylase
MTAETHTMLPQETIRRKRDGLELGDGEIASFVDGVTSGAVSEAQIGAFTMAVYLRGMTPRETVALTVAMRDSGRVVDWGAAGVDDRRVVDKHSSGGVGDEKITLLVAPIAAACGVFVPNLSARGLDYCAGEVDLLDAIPGYDTAPPVETFVRAVADTGAAVIGPTLDLAPADRRIYYVRDVTATVESVPLITGSILSKKLASAPRALVVSVGCGSGAYMADLAAAKRLANSMADVAAGTGLASVMLITNLDTVLGSSVGNAVAVREAVDFLTGRRRDPRVEELTLSLVAEMVVLAGISPDADAARALAAQRLADGSGADRFGRMVEALGGPRDFVERFDSYLPKARVVRPVLAGRDGYVEGMDAREIGSTLVQLGGGRKRPDDEIDLSVGLTALPQVGERVERDTPVCVVHARDDATWEQAAERVRSAIRLGDASVDAAPVVLERLSRDVL